MIPTFIVPKIKQKLFVDRSISFSPEDDLYETIRFPDVREVDFDFEDLWIKIGDTFIQLIHAESLHDQMKRLSEYHSMNSYRAIDYTKDRFYIESLKTREGLKGWKSLVDSTLEDLNNRTYHIGDILSQAVFRIPKDSSAYEKLQELQKQLQNPTLYM